MSRLSVSGHLDAGQVEGEIAEVNKTLHDSGPGVSGHRVRPRWRDDVHAATERSGEFLCGFHGERRLANGDRFACHGDHFSPGGINSIGGVSPEGGCFSVIQIGRLPAVISITYWSRSL